MMGLQGVGRRGAGRAVGLRGAGSEPMRGAAIVRVATRWGMAMAAVLAMALGPLTVRAFEGYVDLQGVHGSSSDEIRILVDGGPPQLSITSPLDGSVIAGSSVTVSGTAEDWADEEARLLAPLFTEVRWVAYDEGFVPIGAGVVPVMGGRFTIPDIALGAGTHSIEIEAVDAAGVRAWSGVGLTCDPDAPPVGLVGIADGHAVLSSSISVDLNFAAPATIVSVNGEPDGRSFDAGVVRDALRLELDVGANPVDLVVDAGGRVIRHSFTLFRTESTGPIEIVSPASGSVTNQGAVVVVGRVPRGTPLVRVNGQTAALDPDGVTFTASVELQEGANPIRVQAFPFGQQREIRVVRDTVPPVIRSVFPGDGESTRESHVSLAGRVSEPGILVAQGPGGSVSGRTVARILFPGAAFGAPAQGDSMFELPPLELVNGANPIEIRLRDAAGNESVRLVSVTRSGVGVDLVSPIDGGSLPGLRTPVRLASLVHGRIESVSAAGRRLPAFDAMAIASGPVDLVDVPLVPGANEIRIVYEREDTQAREVLHFTLYSEATQVGTVTGTVRDPSSGEPVAGSLVSVIVDGRELIVPTAVDGSFRVDVEPGTVELRARALGYHELAITREVRLGEVSEASMDLVRWFGDAVTVTGEPASWEHSYASGRVTDAASGGGIEGASVRALQSGREIATTTDASGQFAIERIPVGDFEVVATQEGYFPRRFAVHAPRALLSVLDISLMPLSARATVAGVVRDEGSGEPMPDVEVAVLSAGIESTTGSDGSFVLEGVPAGEVTIRVRKGDREGHRRVSGIEPSPSGAPFVVELELPLEPTGGAFPVIPPDATLLVRDELSGVPLAGARLRVGDRVWVADAEGRVALAGLPEFEFVEIVASAEDHEEESLLVFAVPDAEDGASIDLRPTTRGLVRGFVTDAQTGAPIRMASVGVDGGTFLVTASGPDGEYQLAAVPAGTHALRIEHPEYLPVAIEAVAVADDAEVEASVSLVRKPVTGGLAGRITDAATSRPIAGAIVSATGEARSTTDVDGRYELRGLRAGLVTLAIEASGFTPSARTTAVIADRDPDTPTILQADFALGADDEAIRTEESVLEAAVGGVVQTPDARLAVFVPPGSLSEDARVIVRTSETSRVVSGAVLDLDSGLGFETVRAVGPQVELLVAPLIEGDPVPSLTGPIVLVLRYAADQAEAAGIEEDALHPYSFDGSRWTMLRTVPYLHAVDRIDKVVLVGMLPQETELGVPVAAALSTERPVRLAALNIVSNYGAVHQYMFQLGANEDDGEDDEPFAAVHDLIGRFPDVHPNALPLFIAHGWNPKALFGDVDLLDEPLENGSYGRMIEDLVAGTDGVYRPVFLTYNSRMSILQSGNLLGHAIFARIQGGGLRGLPPHDDETKGRFEVANSFGFSMGGLVVRTLACAVGQSENMVTLATPHHGALQALVTAIEVARAAAALKYWPLRFFQPRLLLSLWSPGTADLLDYEDVTGVGNPRLHAVNRPGSCASPGDRMNVIGGTDGGLVGLLTVGELPNDKVVPLRSAHASSRSGRTVPALAPHIAERHQHRFSHTNVGEEVPISEFAGTDIFPVLSDWVVGTIVRKATLPPVSTGGPERFEVEAEIAYNVPHGKITGVALVIYRQDGNDEWHIEYGADPDSFEVTEAVSVSGNSLESNDKDERMKLIGKFDIPVRVAGRPETETKKVQILLPTITDEDREVPEEPQGDFGLPER